MTFVGESVYCSGRVLFVLGAALVFGCWHTLAAQSAIEEVQLPPLRIHGKVAKAHTQGLEVVDGSYYVTARRDDVTPRRALLLRTAPGKSDWDVWDITPDASPDSKGLLDHPGGMQSDGQRLWIPLAESKSNGRSVILVFPLVGIMAGKKLEPEFAFPFNDHIGAIAVAARPRLVFGANWDTETVYVWDFEGRLKQKLTGSALESRGLGVVTSGKGHAGVAVQDWKFVGDRLCASGLFRAPGSLATPPHSRWLSFDQFLEPNFKQRIVTIPLHGTTELAREGMAVSGGRIYFLPNDLGGSNRLFQAATSGLLMQADPR